MMKIILIKMRNLETICFNWRVLRGSWIYLWDYGMALLVAVTGSANEHAWNKT